MDEAEEFGWFSLSFFFVRRYLIVRPTATGKNPRQSHEDVGAIVGAVLGSIVGVACLVSLTVVLLYFRRQRRERKRWTGNSKMNDIYVEFGGLPSSQQQKQNDSFGSRFFNSLTKFRSNPAPIAGYTIDDEDRLKVDNMVMYEEVLDISPDSPTSSVDLHTEVHHAPPSSLGSLSRHANTGPSVDSDEDDEEYNDDAPERRGPSIYIPPGLRAGKDKLSPQVPFGPDPFPSFEYPQPVRASRSMSTVRSRWTEANCPAPGIEQALSSSSSAAVPAPGNSNTTGVYGSNPLEQGARSDRSLPLSHSQGPSSSERSRHNIEYITPKVTATTMLFPPSVRGAGYRGTPDSPAPFT